MPHSEFESQPTQPDPVFNYEPKNVKNPNKKYYKKTNAAAETRFCFCGALQMYVLPHLNKILNTINVIGFAEIAAELEMLHTRMYNQLIEGEYQRVR